MQSTLTCAIDVVVLTFSLVMVVDFFVGWFLTFQKTVATSQDLSLTTLTAQPVHNSQSAVQPPQADWQAQKEELKLTLPLQTSSPPTKPITPEEHKTGTSTQVTEKGLGRDIPSQIAEKDTNPDVPPQVERLSFDTFSRKTSFEQVCADFTKSGLTFERYRSGSYKYRVTKSGAPSFQFKKLQEAMDWLTVSEQTSK